MLQKRQPLGVLDSNKQVNLDKQRVQPARAAKTSHKWLSQRAEENKEPGKPWGYSIAGPFMKSAVSHQDKENIGANRIIAYAKSKSEHHEQHEDKPRHRKPLQTLSVPPMRPVARRNADDAMNIISGYEKTFFPPLPKYSDDESDDSTMSVSLDTISNSSFVDYDIADPNYNNDSAFFSCTQTSVPSVNSHDSHFGKDKADHNRTKMISKRTTVQLDHNVDIIQEYFLDILSNMRVAESKYRIPSNFMQKQPEITSNMRTKLVDWLIEVQDEYKLENETVALAVTYCDRFLSLMSVARSKLQLLGTTAMFIAAKYEEIYPPDADEFAYVTADTYAKSEVIMMERLILKVLSSNMAVPTPHQFLGLLLHDSNATDQFKALATYLTEISMLHDRCYQYSNSVLAAAAISAAHCLTNNQSGTIEVKSPKFLKSAGCYCRICPTVRTYMKDCQDEIYACSLELIESHRNIETAPQQFVREKYSTKKNFKVSSVPSMGACNDGIQNRKTALIKDSIKSFWA